MEILGSIGTRTSSWNMHIMGYIIILCVYNPNLAHDSYGRAIWSMGNCDISFWMTAYHKNLFQGPIKLTLAWDRFTLWQDYYILVDCFIDMPNQSIKNY